MTQAPEGALLSEDGHWWWDEPAQQRRPVGDQAVPAGGDGDRVAARVAAGLPAGDALLSPAITRRPIDEYLGRAQLVVFGYECGLVPACGGQS